MKISKVLSVFALLIILLPASAAKQEQIPYREENVTFHVGEITLAGTLTLPNEKGRHPAVILISGSNADNRDAQIGEFRPFYLIADHLSRKGVAVLRYDDRGVGESSGKHTWQYTNLDFKDDVLAAVKFLNERDDIKTDQIGLVGHSMGGVVAPMVAAESDDIPFIVLLAGYGIKTADLMLGLRRYFERISGKSEEEIKESIQFEKTVVNKAVVENWSLERLTSEMKLRAKNYYKKLTTEELKKYATFEDYFKSTWDYSLLSFALTPFYRQNLDYIPAKTLEKVTCPVLMFFAEDDPQVTPKANIEIMKQALENGGNNHYEVKIVPNANHFFIETGKPMREFAPKFLEDLSNWILAQFGDIDNSGWSVERHPQQEGTKISSKRISFF